MVLLTVVVRLATDFWQKKRWKRTIVGPAGGNTYLATHPSVITNIPQFYAHPGEENPFFGHASPRLLSLLPGFNTFFV